MASILWQPIPQPVYQTTDTFQQLVNKLNDGRMQLDSDLSYLDSAIGPFQEGSTFEKVYGLTTTAYTLIDAIRELDEDLHGQGGGTFSTMTTTNSSNVVGAINEIEAVFDASQGRIDTTGPLTSTSNGDTSFSPTGDFLVDATGSIIFDTDDNTVVLRDGSTVDDAPVNRFTYTLGGSNVLDVIGNYTMTSTGDIHIESQSGDFELRNAGPAFDGVGAGVVTTTLSTTTNHHKVITPTHTTLKGGGNIYLSPLGTGAGQDEGLVILTDVNENTIYSFKVVDVTALDENNDLINSTAEFTINGPSARIKNSSGPLEVRSSGSITLRSATGEILLDNNGTRLANFTDASGHLKVNSGSTGRNALRFYDADNGEDVGQTNLQVYGMITLPDTGAGSISSSEITSNTVHGAIDEVNARIPTVYNAAGVALNA